MHRLLIPLFVGLVGIATTLHAQVPKSISVLSPLKPSAKIKSADAPCGNIAGTITLGASGVNTQSNDLTLDTIFLCAGDSIFIDHNNDGSLAGDPVPGTPGGFGYFFYDCEPYVPGNDLQNVAMDSCILFDMTGLLPLIAATSNLSGDMWFFNSGFLQTTFNAGLPLLLHFAPATYDAYNATNGNPVFESAQVGFPPGPCVDVDTAAKFAVVYLNAITSTGDTNNFKNDCLGRFNIKGGYPQYEPTARYTIDVSLATDPTVKGLIHLPPSQYAHNANIIFSVPQPGLYNITVEDGKSCGYTTQINMDVCDPSDNVGISFPNLVSPPGSQICIPITVENFTQIVSGNFSIQWDENLLQYDTFNNPHPLIAQFFSAFDNLNEFQVGQGKLGLSIYQHVPIGGPVTIPDGGTLLEICFTVIGPLGACSPITVTNTPGAVDVQAQQGVLALTGTPGQVCIGFLPLGLKVEVIDTTCLPSATLKVTASGGDPSYDLTWQKLPGGATTLATIANSGGVYTSSPGALLMNGDYAVCIRDSNGIGQILCDTITVNFTTLGAALDLTDMPSCAGLLDGSVMANAFIGGNPAPDPNAFNYTWDPTLPNQPTQTGVGAGVYKVTVTDKNSGCSAVASGTLGQPFPISEQSIFVGDASCSGIADGSISYVAEGGTPFPGNEYDFTWYYSEDGNPPFQQLPAGGLASTFDLLALEAGFYRVKITDANGCMFTDSSGTLEVQNLRTLEVQGLVTNAKCNGGSDGVIDVQVIANPPFSNPVYFFVWEPAGIGTELSDPAGFSSLAGLPADTFFVTAIEAISGCSSDTAFFIVNQPTPLVLDTLSFKNPGCTFGNDGSICVFATGGTTNGPNGYTYVWSQPPPFPSNCLSGLIPGSYAVTVTDLNGCTDTLSFDLALPLPPVITQVDSTSVKCGGDGCLSVTAPTATVFLWENIAGDSIGNTAQICNLDGDTYIVTLHDANNCVTTDTFVLAPGVPLTLDTFTLNKPSCFGYPDGSIIVGIQGGSPSYTYNWQPGNAAMPILSGVPAGQYILNVTDQKGCVITDTFKLVNPPEIKSSITLANATCADSCNGKADVSALYLDLSTQPVSVKPGDFTFSWDDGSSDSVRVDLCPGKHLVTITDGNNCFRIDSVTIGSPAPVVADTIFSLPVTCYADSNGVATVVGQGGNGAPFTYLWSLDALTTPTITNLIAGSYSVTITDKSGCAGTATVEVGTPNPIVVLQDDAESSSPTCFGDKDGVLAVIINGGNPGAFTYVWENSDSVMVSTTNPATDLSAGQYMVTVTDSEGCIGVSPLLTLTEPEAVQGFLLPFEPLLCNGDETVIKIDTIFGGAGGPYMYSIDNGVTLNADVEYSVGGGDHLITYLDRIGCEQTDTLPITEPLPITVTFDPPVLEIELGDSIQLNPIITGAVVDSFFWMPAQYLLHPTSLTPKAYTFESGTFTITVFDAKGCVGVGSIVINVDPNRNVYVPNAFYPGNPAGKNDFFNPMVGPGVQLVNYMQVYDRWGELMYERNAFYPNGDILSEGWDGRYNSDYVTPGVYIYVIEVLFLDGRVLLYRGDVTVVR